MNYKLKNNNISQKVGVIGHPINHSKSPLIHNYYLKKLLIPIEYIAVDIPSSDDIEPFITNAINHAWFGFNVTVPYKQDVLTYLDDIDEPVRYMNACNTVVIEDGRLLGKNTDADGFYYPIKDQSFASALVFGNGGASRAVLFQLCNVGVKHVMLVVRNSRKSDDYVVQLSHDFGVDIQTETFDSFHKKPGCIRAFELVVNATSCGLNDSDPVFDSIHELSNNQLFYDLIYNPWDTKMMKIAQNQGVKTINGASMLAHQAALAFHSFFGELPDTNIMIELLEKDVKL